MPNLHPVRFWASAVQANDRLDSQKFEVSERLLQVEPDLIKEIARQAIIENGHAPIRDGIRLDTAATLAIARWIPAANVLQAHKEGRSAYIVVSRRDIATFMVATSQLEQMPQHWREPILAFANKDAVDRHRANQAETLMTQHDPTLESSNTWGCPSP